jgi:hypothetical protein
MLCGSIATVSGSLTLPKELGNGIGSVYRALEAAGAPIP